MKRGLRLFLVLSLAIIICISFVSAGFWGKLFGITGHAVFVTEEGDFNVFAGDRIVLNGVEVKVDEIHNVSIEGVNITQIKMSGDMDVNENAGLYYLQAGETAKIVKGATTKPRSYNMSIYVNEIVLDAEDPDFSYANVSVAIINEEIVYTGEECVANGGVCTNIGDCVGIEVTVDCPFTESCCLECEDTDGDDKYVQGSVTSGGVTTDDVCIE